MAAPTSHFIKTVCVKDWWLTKADNNSLRNTVAVAGIESAGQQAARVFYSAPIVQRLDLFTLKTADGIYVLLNGCINKEQTCENGFSEEVFKHFLIGFPTNWEECAEKCLRQGVGSEATADADLNPDEAKEANIELLDDQNIDSVEERSFRDAQSDAQNHNMDRHETVGCHDGDACINTDIHDSNAGFREEGVRYSLRNRTVPYFEAKEGYKHKHVKNVAKSKSFSKKTMTGADTLTIPSVASLENPQPPGMASLCDQSLKEQAEHPTFAASEGVNDAIHAKNIDTSRSMSISAEALAVDNSVHRIKKAQKSRTHDDMASILQDAGKAKNLTSHLSFGRKSCKSKKRKRRTAQENIVTPRPLLTKTGENTDAFATSLVAALENLAKSGVAAVEGNNIEQTLDHFRSAVVKAKKRSICEDSPLVETHHICAEKSHGSKKERKQRSFLTTTIKDDKNCHGSARPTSRTCTSKAKSNSKSDAVEQELTASTSKAKSSSQIAAADLERKASQGSTPKLGTRRKLDYAEKTTGAAKGENKTPISCSSVVRTSRSGRLLLPTMEFWRNQLPIYDADHGISGIREGSSTFKLKRGRKSSTKKRKRGFNWS